MWERREKNDAQRPRQEDEEAATTNQKSGSVSTFPRTALLGRTIQVDYSGSDVGWLDSSTNREPRNNSFCIFLASSTNSSAMDPSTIMDSLAVAPQVSEKSTSAGEEESVGRKRNALDWKDAPEVATNAGSINADTHSPPQAASSSPSRNQSAKENRKLSFLPSPLCNDSFETYQQSLSNVWPSIANTIRLTELYESETQGKVAHTHAHDDSSTESSLSSMENCKQINNEICPTKNNEMQNIITQRDESDDDSLLGKSNAKSSLENSEKATGASNKVKYAIANEPSASLKRQSVSPGQAIRNKEIIGSQLSPIPTSKSLPPREITSSNVARLSQKLLDETSDSASFGHSSVSPNKLRATKRNAKQPKMTGHDGDDDQSISSSSSSTISSVSFQLGRASRNALHCRSQKPASSNKHRPQSAALMPGTHDFPVELDDSSSEDEERKPSARSKCQPTFQSDRFSSATVRRTNSRYNKRSAERSTSKQRENAFTSGTRDCPVELDDSSCDGGDCKLKESKESRVARQRDQLLPFSKRNHFGNNQDSSSVSSSDSSKMNLNEYLSRHRKLRGRRTLKMAKTDPIEESKKEIALILSTTGTSNAELDDKDVLAARENLNNESEGACEDDGGDISFKSNLKRSPQTKGRCENSGACENLGDDSTKPHLPATNTVQFQEESTLHDMARISAKKRKQAGIAADIGNMYYVSHGIFKKVESLAYVILDSNKEELKDEHGNICIQWDDRQEREFVSPERIQRDFEIYSYNHKSTAEYDAPRKVRRTGRQRKPVDFFKCDASSDNADEVKHESVQCKEEMLHSISEARQRSSKAEDSKGVVLKAKKGRTATKKQQKKKEVQSTCSNRGGIKKERDNISRTKPTGNKKFRTKAADLGAAVSVEHRKTECPARVVKDLDAGTDKKVENDFILIQWDGSCEREWVLAKLIRWPTCTATEEGLQTRRSGRRRQKPDYLALNALKESPKKIATKTGQKCSSSEGNTREPATKRHNEGGPKENNVTGFMVKPTSSETASELSPNTDAFVSDNAASTECTTEPSSLLSSERPVRNYKNVWPTTLEVNRGSEAKPKPKVDPTLSVKKGDLVYFVNPEVCNRRRVHREKLQQGGAARVVGESFFSSSKHQRLLQLQCLSMGSRWYAKESDITRTYFEQD